MEKVVRFLLGVSLIICLVLSTVILGYTMYFGSNRSRVSDEIDFPRPLSVAFCISSIVFLICIFLMCIFEIIRIYKINGIKGIVILGIFFVIVFCGSILFNKVILEEDNSLIKSVILTLGIMMLGLMMSSYRRIKKEK